MAAFKVGDRVRVTEDNCGFGDVGDEGFVTVEDAGDEDCMVRLDQKRCGDYEWFIPQSSLEIVADPFADWDYDPRGANDAVKSAFKVGDRVYAAWGGIEGDGIIVAEDRSKDGMRYQVRFDTSFPSPLWVYDETVRLLDESAPDEPDAPLTVSIIADTSQLDAEIDRIVGRLTDLQSLATSLGIRLGTSQLQDA